jgi:hypothetical protein
MKEKREILADKQHQIWSHWMQWMFRQGKLNANGSWTLPKDKVDLWHRQMNTPYHSLTEEEKESDRKVVDEFGLIDVR